MEIENLEINVFDIEVELHVKAIVAPFEKGEDEVIVEDHW